MTLIGFLSRPRIHREKARVIAQIGTDTTVDCRYYVPMNDSPLRRLRDRAGGSPTLINEGCKITGLISGSGDFQIAGEVDGDCEIDGTVTLTKTGFWNGTIKADHIVVAGHVDGDIVATGRVEITDTAKIAGTVSADAIAVAEGAVVEGIMKTTGRRDPTEFVEKRQSD